MYVILCLAKSAMWQNIQKRQRMARWEQNVKCRTSWTMRGSCT